MQTLYQILGLIGAGMIVWFLYKSIKGRPEQFSKQNMSNSLTTMGILALVLIVFVALLILLLRNT